ncbi:nucleotidyl transferase AbiEii/AbiGii toxin family protein [Taibaiella lutea]|uniref:Nucleotidyl transferase AbiEii/AbiGii toxin family protein n=1 Tax=Taibaiella lutea TaxID=2608001 RepID=A0A5M6CP11_9BACT|nr:nucleotidyl transferase AbiEii/AbiGii toxin family protein [Taibaiella lutea]KAA5536884.1 nucleotidyl transferase AbiEii/AbiGii toxin family protein [Taibaiella lutea]
MLHKDPFIIAPETFKLIQELQKIEELNSFNLVGGTALALKLGHRNSIDIDLFTQNEFDTAFIIDTLRNYFKIELNKTFRNGILCYINDVKVDFIRHNYPFINEPQNEEEITFLSLEDIAAIKLHAISNSGKRLKDFIDAYFLLGQFTLNEMLHFYSIKYPDFNPVIPVRAINYFEDIDPTLDPPLMKIPLSLDKIKKRIKEAIIHPNKRF